MADSLLPTTTALKEETSGVVSSALEFGAEVGDTVLDIGQRAFTGKTPKPPAETLSFPQFKWIKNEAEFNGLQDIFKIIDDINEDPTKAEKYTDKQLDDMDAIGKERAVFQQQLTRHQEQQAKDPGFWDALQKPPENVPLFETTRSIGKGLLIGGEKAVGLVKTILNAGAAAIEVGSGQERAITAEGEWFTFGEQWDWTIQRNDKFLKDLRNSGPVIAAEESLKKRIPDFPPYVSPVSQYLEYGAEIYSEIALPGVFITRKMLSLRSKWVKATENNEEMFVRMYGTGAARQKEYMYKGKFYKEESLSGWMARLFMSSTVRSTPEAIVWGDRLANAGATVGNILATNYVKSFEKGDIDAPGGWIIPVTEMVATVVAPWTLTTGLSWTGGKLKSIRNFLHKPPEGSLESRFEKDTVKGMKGLLAQIDRLPDIHKDILRSQLDEIGSVIKRAAGGDLAREDALWGLVSDSIYAPVMQAVRAQIQQKPHKMGFWLDNIFNRDKDAYTTLRSSQVESTNALIGTIDDLKTKMAASGETMTDDIRAIFDSAQETVDKMRRNLTLEDNKRTYLIEDDARLQESIVKRGLDSLILGEKSSYLSPRVRETLNRIEAGEKVTEIQTAALYRELGANMPDQEFEMLSRSVVQQAYETAQATASQPYKELGNFKLEGDFVVLKKNDAGELVDSGEIISPTTLLRDLESIADQHGLNEALLGIGGRNIGKEGQSIKGYIKSRRKTAVDEMDINEVWEKHPEGLDRDEALLQLADGDITQKQLDAFDANARQALADSDIDVDITMNLEDYQTLRTAALARARKLRGDPTGAGDSRAFAYSEMVDTLDQFMDDILPSIKGEDAGKLFEAQEGWRLYKDSWGRNIGGRQVRKNAAGEKLTGDDVLFVHFFNPPKGMTMRQSRQHYDAMFGDNPEAEMLFNDAFKRWLEETYIKGSLTPEKLRKIANSKGKAGKVIKNFKDILNMDIDGALARAESISGRKAMTKFELQELEADIRTKRTRALRELGQNLNEKRILTERTPESMLHNAGKSSDMKAVHQTLRNLTLPSEGGTVDNVRRLIANAKDPDKMRTLIREVSFLDAVEGSIIRGTGVTKADVGTYGQMVAKRGFDAEALENTLLKNADFWERSGLYTVGEINQMRDISSLLTLVANAPEKVALRGMPSEMALEGVLSRLYAINRGVVSTKFIMAELGIRYFRKQRGKFLAAALMEPAFTKVLHEALIEGRHGSRRFQQRFLNVMVSIAARQGESAIELELLSREGNRLIRDGKFFIPIPEDQQIKLPEIDLRGPDLDSPFGGLEFEDKEPTQKKITMAEREDRILKFRQERADRLQGEEPGSLQPVPSFITKARARRKKRKK